MNIILSLGFVFLIGILASRLMGKIKFPSVVAYLLVGILIGPEVLSILSEDLKHTSGFISNVVLGLIAFGLGQMYMLFFVLAGASLDFSLLLKIGILGLVYVILRTFGKVIGSTWAGYIVNMSSRTKKYLGFALLPQAGVALGCALIVSSELPQAGKIVLTTIVATTVVFELLGPLCTRFALHKAGDTG